MLLSDFAFTGKLHSVRFYSQALSNVDVESLAGLSPAELHLSPLCRCPPSHPVIPSPTSELCTNLDDSGSVTRINSASSPAGFVNDADNRTEWRSSVGVQTANLTMDLSGTREVVFVQVTFTSRRPKVMIIEKSTDGSSWSVMQYFADDCSVEFNMAADATLSASDGIGCTEKYSLSSAGDVLLNVLDAALRPDVADFNNNTALSRFMAATHLRLRLIEPHSAASYPESNYYAISDWVVTGRQCVCNGHASACQGASCVCQHGTTGSQCETCLPLYNDRPWQPGTVQSANPCRVCNCNGHADACTYSSAIGGVCTNCRDNTTGQNCQLCLAGTYHPSSVPLNASNACQACQCTPAGVTDNGDCRRGDQPTGDSGQCSCKANVKGRQCNTCGAGFFNLTESNPAGCQACECNMTGTVGGSASCSASIGQCSCKANVTGLKCDSCLPGHFNLAHPTGCQPCDDQCSSEGCTAAGPTGCKVRAGCKG